MKTRHAFYLLVVTALVVGLGLPAAAAQTPERASPAPVAQADETGTPVAPSNAFGPLSSGVLAGYTLRVSVDSYGLQGDDSSGGRTALSADGRFVVFASEADNLVPGDTNGCMDVFVHDRTTGRTTRVSVDSQGNQADDCYWDYYDGEPTISADGRSVAFQSAAPNLVPGDTNGSYDIFVHDLETGQTVRVSVDAQGNEGNHDSFSASLSADGRFVAFRSRASNLVPGDTNGRDDIFVHDRDADEDGILDEPGAIETIRASVASGGGQANSASDLPSLSADGRVVAYQSSATNLAPGDTNGCDDIFVTNWEALETTRVSVASDGSQADANSEEPAVSADGRSIAFRSGATNLVPGDTNGLDDIFVHDRDAGETTRVSVVSGGGQGPGGAGWPPSITADGRSVAFSYYGALVPGWDDGENVYVHNMQTGETYGLSMRLGGEPSYMANRSPAIAGDGWTVAWTSSDSQLVPNDTNGVMDVFVREDGRLGPCPVNLAASPASVPADGSTAATLTLNCAQPGHQVRIFGSRWVVDPIAQPIGTVDANGQYTTTVTSLSPGWTYFRVQDLTWGGQILDTRALLTFEGGGGPPPPPPGGYGVEIVDVVAQAPLDGAYLSGFSVANRVDVRVDWQGNTPGRVDFILNDQTYSETADGSGASHTFDMGTDLAPGGNLLRIIAFDSSGRWSRARDYLPEGLPLPTWLTGLRDLGAIGEGEWHGSRDNGGEWSFEVKIPPGGWKFGAPGFGPGGSKTELKFTCGGGMSVPVRCSMPLKVWFAAGAELKVELTSVELGGELKFTGTLEAESPCSELPTPTGTVKLELMFYGEKQWPVLTLVPSFIAPPAGEILNGLPDPVKNALGNVYLRAELGGSLQTGATLTAESPYLEWQGITLAAGPALELGYKLQMSEAEVKIYLRGSGLAGFSSPGPIHSVSDLNFDSLTLAGEAGLKVDLVIWETTVKYTVSWVYSPDGWQAVAVPVEVTPWRLVGHSASPTYSSFVAGPEAPQAFAPPEQGAPEWAAQSTVTSTLVSDVYTYTQPSLAVRPGSDQALVVWTHDDPGKPVGQSLEIAYSRWDGSAWSTPAAVTDDNYPDVSPRLAWTGVSTAVAIWERIPEALPITATWDITTAKTIEIATAGYDGGSNTWSPAALLTGNEALDYGPELARNSAGKLLAAWKQNPDGIMGGGEAHPDSIVAAFYDGGWSPPAVAVPGVPSLGDLAVGYGANTATIAYAALITPTGELTPTSQIFTSQWNGSWQTPVQRTDDRLQHHSPQVVYNAADQPLLVWVAGDELRLLNLTTGATASLALADGAAVDRLGAVRGGDGNVAVLFTAQHAQRDLFLSLYDQAHNLWSAPRALSDDWAYEGGPSAAADSTGRLLAAYTAQMESEEPFGGRTDLVTLSHTFTKNLTLGDGDLLLSDAHPEPGSQVVLTATVHNSGDRPLDGVMVAFYDGDPGAGGALIGESSLPWPLAAGFTGTLTVDYAVPGSGGLRALYAVADPYNAIPESDEGDNQVSQEAFGPDVEIADAGAEYWGGSLAGLSTLVRNVGTTTVPTHTLSFYLDAPGGAPLVQAIVPELEAGSAVSLTTPYDFGALGAGEHTLAAVANEGEFPELWLENNVRTFTLSGLPDLMVSPLYLWAEPATGVVTATVINTGMAPAANVVVGFYSEAGLRAGTPLLTRTIAALPAGAAVMVTGQAPAPLEGRLYVYVDPEAAILETTRTNNLANIGDETPVRRILLPIVLCRY